MVLSIEEKTAIAARSRRHPGRPARPGEPVRQEFAYRRHGTASLIAALDVRTGEVLTEVIRRNDAATFTAFLEQLDQAIAPGKEIPAHQQVLAQVELDRTDSAVDAGVLAASLGCVTRGRVEYRVAARD